MGLRGEFAGGFKFMALMLFGAWLFVTVVTRAEGLGDATKLYGGALIVVYALSRLLQAANDRA